LEPLSQLAARRDCVVFGICHFGKRDGADTGKLILGSIAWSQVARSVLSVAQDADSGNLVVTNTKGNLAPRTLSMNATIASTLVRTDDGDAEVGVIQWLGESERDARDLLSGPEDADDDDDRTAAEKWLASYLHQEGKTPAKRVKADARKEAIAEPTLKRAAKKLGVVYEYEGYPATSRWSLPDEPDQKDQREDQSDQQADQSGQQAVGSLTHEPTEPTGDDLGKCDEPTGTLFQLAQLAHVSVSEPTGPRTAPRGVGRRHDWQPCEVCGEGLTVGQVGRHLSCTLVSA
jgi:hypothetical protein